MKKFATALLLAAHVALATACAWADDSYYIEVGGDTARDEALNQWKTLVTQHRKLLSNLQVYPKSVMRGSKETAVRLQAGPIDNKTKAQKICSALFAKNISCFVIEGAVAAPPSLVAGMAMPPAPPLPWLAAGHVDVAEAIHVPLSDQSHNYDPADSGWLNVDLFASDSSAIEFWHNVRSSAPTGLRVRIVRPPRAPDDPRAVLNIGPFASRDDALSFCQDDIQATDKNLHCRFDISESDGTAVAASRQQIMAQRGGQMAKLAPTAAAPAQLYWVQVLSATSQLEALRAWEDLKTANPDILTGRRSSVSALPADKTQYVVRVGPMASDADAMGLCDTLKGRGVDCSVLLYSAM